MVWRWNTRDRVNEQMILFVAEKKMSVVPEFGNQFKVVA